ncbi:hypothetical protein [Filimonas effusa]|uniref:Uncharacterized protein n=1 Tax=Filimonas effusa TaxID=2508721 RepID=A0A4Q1DBV5_9BACT|nr:hypothetical protein [Filimonas effusa]RXK86922.1 hypothetical protein ESB13_09085 [Filimonas effusa]
MKSLIILSLFPLHVFCQTGFIKAGNFFDQHAVNTIVKDVKRNGNRLLVYMPARAVSFTSIVIVQNTKDTVYWLIKHDSVMAKGKLSGSKIFLYPHYLKTGAVKKEERLKFVPPMICGDSTACIIYEDAYRKFYFEYGPNIGGYIPDPGLDKYRKEWLNIIAAEVDKLIS